MFTLKFDDLRVSVVFPTNAMSGWKQALLKEMEYFYENKPHNNNKNKMACKNNVGGMQATCEARHLQSRSCHTVAVCRIKAKNYVVLFYC